MDDDIIEDDNKNVEAASTSIPQLTLEKSISIKYRTLSIQTSESIQAQKLYLKKEKTHNFSDDEIAQLDYHTLPVNLIWQRVKAMQPSASKFSNILLWFAAIIMILSYQPFGMPNPAPIEPCVGECSDNCSNYSSRVWCVSRLVNIKGDEVD
ncbi:unnamed protein product [Rhizophagus irregularis]|nr:unnamed protein product [Rhizophagus irregularis]